MTITQAIKSAAINGSISLDRALKIAQHFDDERNKTNEILDECRSNVGMMLGEKINEHQAGMNGTYFNARDYHYERPVGEQ